MDDLPVRTRADPIDAAEAEDLIPPLTAQAELNEWEEQNIIAGRHWALSKRVHSQAEPLSEDFLFKLHRRMFDDTWKRAGEIRTRDKNIGVPFYKIRVCLKELLDDARYWRDNRTYSFDEFAMRFHHRLVQIHLFPNGNGRHARLAVDVIARKSGQSDFSWGSVNLAKPGEARAAYLDAIHAADDGDYRPLVTFSRS
ncbi:MAG TPA: mobile mystery protein B [Spartobacteria bacterium]|jgi:Fic-DOC domain mobile mystery protein B|nr:mobile mystery protein B [Spartobacteria bacterium]